MRQQETSETMRSLLASIRQAINEAQAELRERRSAQMAAAADDKANGETAGDAARERATEDATAEDATADSRPEPAPVAAAAPAAAVTAAMLDAAPTADSGNEMADAAWSDTAPAAIESVMAGNHPGNEFAAANVMEDAAAPEMAKSGRETRRAAVITPLYPSARADAVAGAMADAEGENLRLAAAGGEGATVSRLPPRVQARVKDAMARMERIEAARRALGGDEALRQLVEDLVQPLVREWLERHLAEIVERQVAAEIARITSGR